MSSELTPVLVPALVTPEDFLKWTALGSLSHSWCFLPEATSSSWCHRYTKRLGGDRLLSIQAHRGPECYRAIRADTFLHSLATTHIILIYAFWFPFPFVSFSHSVRMGTQHCIGQRTWPCEDSKTTQFMRPWQSVKNKMSPLCHKIPWWASWAPGIQCFSMSMNHPDSMFLETQFCCGVTLERWYKFQRHGLYLFVLNPTWILIQ